MADAARESSRRLLVALTIVVALLMVAGAVSFYYYARSHAPSARRVAVAPFDIFAPAPELAGWRVELADSLTRRLGVTPPLSAVPQAVVAQTWRSAPRPEIAAVELARRTGAGIAVYGRVDALPRAGDDSVLVTLLAADAVTTRVLFRIELRRPAAGTGAIGAIAAALAEEIRLNLLGASRPI